MNLHRNIKMKHSFQIDALLSKAALQTRTQRGREKRGRSDSLGPLTETFSSPLPAPLVKTLKSATSFTLTPFGWRPLPVALQAFGFTAESNDNGFEGRSFRKESEQLLRVAAEMVSSRDNPFGVCLD